MLLRLLPLDAQAARSVQVETTLTPLAKYLGPRVGQILGVPVSEAHDTLYCV